MNSSVKGGRVFRGSPESEEVYVLDGRARAAMPARAAIATAADVVAAAEAEAAALVGAAEAEATGIVAKARAEADEVRQAAFAAGAEAGRDEAVAAVEGYVALARRAAEEGKAIRDGLAAQSAAVVAQAVALAVRRVVGEYYAIDPARTAVICGEALRAASGQQVLRMRVHPAAADAVRASFAEAAEYIRPDGGVEVGSCIIDLEQGTIDASLDARFSLLELALAEAGGQVAG